jgi:predicted hotdog family 3-hydroxylacyl-ACP dehydratase
MSGADPFPPVATLVPHRGRALFLREVLRAAGDTASCRARIPADSPFVNAGAAPSLVGLDVAAQAAAALEALLRAGPSESGALRLGYVVGIREARFDAATLPADTDLTVDVHLLEGASALAAHEVELRIGSTRCLSAVLTTFKPRLDPSRP